MHVLLTGGSGFVGTRLAQRLIEAGHRVIALLRPGAPAPAGCGVLRHALGTGGALALPEDLDAVIHCAQSRACRSFPADAEEMFRVNVAGTQSLLAAAAGAKVSRFCLVSTGTVYEPFAGPLTETAALAPLSYLGASKYAAEVLARPFGSLFALSVLRLFAPYGPGQTGRLVPDLVGRVRDGRPVSLPEQGGGMQFSPTYVDDICEVIIAALNHGWNEVVNVAGPERLSIEEAALIIGAVLGLDPIFERKPLSAPTIVPDLTRLARRHDLSRFRPFREGIANIIGTGLTP